MWCGWHCWDKFTIWSDQQIIGNQAIEQVSILILIRTLIGFLIAFSSASSNSNRFEADQVETIIIDCDWIVALNVFFLIVRSLISLLTVNNTWLSSFSCSARFPMVQDSKIPTYQKMWKYMDHNRHVFVKKYEHGVQRVLEGNYHWFVINDLFITKPTLNQSEYVFIRNLFGNVLVKEITRFWWSRPCWITWFSEIATLRRSADCSTRKDTESQHLWVIRLNLHSMPFSTTRISFGLVAQITANKAEVATVECDWWM
jgi:hypothetical protein